MKDEDYKGSVISSEFQAGYTSCCFFWKCLPVLLNAPLLISACQGEFNSASILSLFLVARKDTAYHINSDRNIHLYTTLQFMSVCSVTQSYPILREVYVYLYSHCMSMYVCIR